MSEQLRAQIKKAILSLTVTIDSALYFIGVHTFPEQAYREIRIGPDSTLSRQYLYYKNSETRNDITTAKYNVFTFIPRYCEEPLY